MQSLIEIIISKKALKYNFKVIKNLTGRKVLIAPCVKSNAYGHGILQVAKTLISSGADWLSVESIEEAQILRKAGVKIPIQVIGYIQQKDLKKAVELRLILLVYNIETVKIISRFKKQVNIVLKVDTGMGRQGVLPSDIVKFIRFVKKHKHINVLSIATHFATSDEPENKKYFLNQKQTLKKIINELKKNNINISIYQCDNSGALLLNNDTHYNLIRPGISIYGLYPSESVRKICQKNNIFLKPSLTLKTKVAQIKVLQKGSYISYGATFKTKKKTRVAIIPIGYYDGLDRKLSNKGSVLIRGKRARILGRVCMNILIVDASNIKNIRQEDEVVVIGKQGNLEITAEEIAKQTKTINYEVITRLRESIKRIFK